ncbi:MAG: methylenetetrahydrofolate reductase [NAD(P)H] [Planctomycetales bacterium]|nr:methylenetetrahydrofolate reductase [NAD(P)H] [Planctomycetales bacterium]
MKISEAYGPEKFGLSFELFPPKSQQGEDALIKHVAQLMVYRPSYITCTYGAGGSTRDKTLDVVDRVHQQFGVAVASHLTCVGSTVDSLREYLVLAARRGVENIVALRGDPPRGETEFKPVAGGFSYANELVGLIRAEFPQFGIAVAGYPEKHLEAPSPEVDLDNLKRKVESGADAVITQLFYDNDDFYRFRDRYTAAGIPAPLVPGLLPVTNLAQIQRITSLCGAKLPANFIQALEAAGEDDQAAFDIGVEFASQQAQDLVAHDIPGLHFYVLNKSQATSRVLDAVGLNR